MSTFDQLLFDVWIPDMDDAYKSLPTFRHFLLAGESLKLYVLIKCKNDSVINEENKNELPKAQVCLNLTDCLKDRALKSKPLYQKDSVFPICYLNNKTILKEPKWMQYMYVQENLVGYIEIQIKITVPKYCCNIPLCLNTIIKPSSLIKISTKERYLQPVFPLENINNPPHQRLLQSMFTFSENISKSILEIKKDVVVYNPLKVTCSGRGLSATVTVENVLSDMSICIDSFSSSLSHIKPLIASPDSDIIQYIENIPPTTVPSNFNYIDIRTIIPKSKMTIGPKEKLSYMIYIDSSSIDLLSKEIRQTGCYLYIYTVINLRQPSCQNNINQSFYLQYYISPPALVSIHIDIPEEIPMEKNVDCYIHITNNTTDSLLPLLFDLSNNNQNIQFIHLSPSSFQISQLEPSHTFDYRLTLRILQKGKYEFPHFSITDQKHNHYPYKGIFPTLYCT
ncbi:hypothetical protein WA158_000301 [Blastocystis sp. Blastoise]